MKSKPLFPRDYVAPRWIDPISLQIIRKKQYLLYETLLHLAKKKTHRIINPWNTLESKSSYWMA